MNSFVKGILYFVVFAALLFAAVFGGRYVKTYLTKARADVVPESVQVKEITQTTAKITWQTDKESQSVINYGTDSQNLPLMAFESEATTAHEVSLSLLSPQTTYFFKIKVGEKDFTDAGLPWQFSTLATTAEPAAAATIECDATKFQAKFGTADSLYDLNKDGIVNSTDFSLCLQGQ